MKRDFKTHEEFRTVCYKVRKQLELTMQEVGRMIGCTHSTIAHLESGASMPSKKLLAKLCNLYSLNWDEVIVIFADYKRNLLEKRLER
jgi:transcriptional regulator with XRE-family HTH domain